MWCNGARKLSVPGRQNNLDNSLARAYCACSTCGWGSYLDIFSLVYQFSFLSSSVGKNIQNMNFTEGSIHFINVKCYDHSCKILCVSVTDHCLLMRPKM